MRPSHGKKELAQDPDTGYVWHREFAEVLPHEGKPLDDASFGYSITPGGKFPRGMTRDEIAANWQEVNKGQIKEINGLYDLWRFQRYPRPKSHNIIDARRVITWKVIEGNVGAKCRLIVRGFKDQPQDLDTYVGTISRSGQRIVNAVAAENEHFILSSFDVNQASVKWLRFEDLSKLTGTECRAVQFDVPMADLDCLKQIRGFENFNPAIEILTMLKPIYGLNGAPRAWRKKLHQVLEGWLQCRQLYAEPELYCVHKCQQGRSNDILGRAQAHNLEQQEAEDSIRKFD